MTPPPPLSLFPFSLIPSSYFEDEDDNEWGFQTALSTPKKEVVQSQPAMSINIVSVQTSESGKFQTNSLNLYFFLIFFLLQESKSETNVNCTSLDTSSSSSNLAYEDEKYMPKFSQDEWDLKVVRSK